MLPGKLVTGRVPNSGVKTTFVVAVSAVVSALVARVKPL